jgi:hypothetical protein
MPGRSLVSGRYLVANTGRVWKPWWLMGGVRPQDCVAAYQPMGAHNLTESYTNLNNPARFNAAPGVAPTWSALNGWGFDGAATYLDLGFIPGDNWSAIIRYSAMPAANSRAMFGNRGDPRFYVNNAASLQFNYNTAGYSLTDISRPSGVIGMSKTSYVKDSVITAYAPGWAGALTKTCVIGGFKREAGNVDSLLAYNVLAVAFYSTDISPQFIRLTYAMNHCTEYQYNGWMKPTEMLGWTRKAGAVSISPSFGIGASRAVRIVPSRKVGL